MGESVLSKQLNWNRPQKIAASFDKFRHLERAADRILIVKPPKKKRRRHDLKAPALYIGSKFDEGVANADYDTPPWDE